MKFAHWNQGSIADIKTTFDQIAQLKYALEMEMDTVTDLRELLDTVRRIAYELNEEILKDVHAQTTK